jgi:hypothetical protein
MASKDGFDMGSTDDYQSLDQQQHSKVMSRRNLSHSKFDFLKHNISTSG